MQLRPLQGTDSDALLRLLQVTLCFDLVTADLMQEKVWQDPDFCADKAWVAIAEDNLCGFAMGVQRNGRGYIKFLCVHPDRRNQGVGAELLGKVEGTLRGPIRIAESNPNYLTPGVDVRHTVGILFLEKHGYEKVGETYNLHCDLASDIFHLEEPPAGLSVRRAEPEDWPSIFAFLENNFAGWVHEANVMMKNSPVSLHLAWRGQHLVGFAGYDGNNLGTGWFGPMGTDPQQRRLGVGRVLLRRCLADLKEQGHQHCVIPWVGPYGFYARHSLSRIERVFWRFEKGPEAAF